MNSRLLLLFFWVGVMHCFGGAPDKLDGFIYYESGRTIARSLYEFGGIFSPPGVFTGLYFRGSAPIPGSPFILSAPESGGFIYRKIDDFTAELTLTTPSGSMPQSGKRMLRFTSDFEGSALGEGEGTSILSAGFRLALLTARSPLVNCSNRSTVNAGSAAFTGFVVTGDSSRTVLVRAVGPSLAPFGILDFLRNPALSVTRSSDATAVGANDDWSSESADSISRVATAVGAFPLQPASKDAALIVTLSPGAYVARVNSPDATDSGQALIEVYMLP